MSQRLPAISLAMMLTQDILNLRRMRAVLGLTQFSVSVGSGVNMGRISKAESGKLELSETEMRALRVFMEKQWKIQQEIEQGNQDHAHPWTVQEKSGANAQVSLSRRMQLVVNACELGGISKPELSDHARLPLSRIDQVFGADEPSHDEIKALEAGVYVAYRQKLAALAKLSEVFEFEEAVPA